MMIMNKAVEHPKWIEWCNKTDEEQYKIAEENGWYWYGNWFECGYLTREAYEKADKDPQVAMKYKGYDNYYKEHEIGESHAFLGPDGHFHRSEKPINTWIEYQPCTNTKCIYYDPTGWGGVGGNCGYLGARERLTDCFDELFARIQSFINVCGIENIDKFQEEFDIHPDIIGWFKEGDEYFKNKESDKMYLKEEAVEEITNLLNEVKKVVKFVGELGITYQSDAWNATNPSSYDHEDIFNWNKENFAHIDITNIDHFCFGGSVCIAEYEWKGKYIGGPKELHQAKVNTVKKYMQEVANDYKGKYFKVSNVTDEDIYDNCGWECFVEFAVTPIKPECLEQTDLDQLVQQIADEEGRAIEDPWIDYDVKNPDDGKKYYAMVGFHSVTLINDEDEEYQGDFGVNGKYINDASKLIRDIENSAEELRIKYADQGVKVTIGDFNIGCRYGMSIYVWVPYHNE